MACDVDTWLVVSALSDILGDVWICYRISGSWCLCVANVTELVVTKTYLRVPVVCRDSYCCVYVSKYCHVARYLLMSADIYRSIGVYGDLLNDWKRLEMSVISEISGMSVTVREIFTPH